MESSKVLLKAMRDSTYLSKSDGKKHWMIDAWLWGKTRRVRGNILVGKIPVLYCDYDNHLGVGKFLQLFPLAGWKCNSILEAYFDGFKSRPNKDMIMRLIEKYYSIFENIIKMHEVRAFLLTGLVGIYEAAILQLSFDRNIPVYCCQHGLYLKLFPHKKLLKNVFFFASGDEEKKILLKEGIKRSHILMTGSPFFDEIVKYKNDVVEKYIVVLTQPLTDGEIDKQKYQNALVEINTMYGKQCRIIAKMHPRDNDVKRYKKLGWSIDKRIPKEHLYKLMASARVVIGFESTAELEAMMLGTQVILYDDVRYDPFPYAYKKIPLSKQMDYIKKNFMLDGRARERIERYLKCHCR